MHSRCRGRSRTPRQARCSASVVSWSVGCDEAHSRGADQPRSEVHGALSGRRWRAGGSRRGQLFRGCGDRPSTCTGEDRHDRCGETRVSSETCRAWGSSRGSQGRGRSPAVDVSGSSASEIHGERGWWLVLLARPALADRLVLHVRVLHTFEVPEIVVTRSSVLPAASISPGRPAGLTYLRGRSRDAPRLQELGHRDGTSRRSRCQFSWASAGLFREGRSPAVKGGAATFPGTPVSRDAGDHRGDVGKFQDARSGVRRIPMRSDTSADIHDRAPRPHSRHGCARRPGARRHRRPPGPARGAARAVMVAPA